MVEGDELMDITITKEEYEAWVSKMDERKYRHYIAWFNVNIKQLNTLEELVTATPEQASPPQQQPDYRIRVPVEPPP